MSETTVKIKKHWAVQIDEEALRRMHSIVSRFVDGNATVSVDFSNDTAISSTNIDEIIDDSNNLGSRIKRVYIRGTSYSSEHGSRSASVTLLDETIIPVISSEATGDVSRVMAFRHEMNNTMTSYRLWYSPWYLSDIVSTIFCFGLTFGLLALFISHVKIDKEYAGLVTVGYFIASVVIWFVARLLLFPRMTFYIGTSKRRSDIRRSVGRFVLTTILIGLLIGVAGNFLTDLIKDYMGNKA